MTEEKKSFPIKWIIYALIGAYVLFNIFTGDGGETDYIEETLEEPTQGIHVELQETEKDLYKITNEELLENRDDSRIIVTYLNATTDTFTIDEVKLSAAGSPQRSMIRTAVYAGLLGYMMGRPMGSGINRGAYANDKAYNKSNQGRSTLRSTARKTTVRKPTASKKGYGSGKSTKSYGG